MRRSFSSIQLTAGASLLAIVVFVAIYAQSAEETPLLKALKNATIGSVVHTEGLSPLPVKAVCVLQPYQDRLGGSDDFAVRVNAFLKKAKYAPDEGHFAFVFIGDDDIMVEQIKRSAKLDMFGEIEIDPVRAGRLPRNFTPQTCVAGPSAAVTKISNNDRTYVVFGAML